MINRYRFKPKPYGRGVTPISKEGRVITVLMVFLLLVPLLIVIWIAELAQISDTFLIVLLIAITASFVIRSALIVFLLKPVTYGSMKWRRGYEDGLKGNPNRMPNELDEQ